MAGNTEEKESQRPPRQILARTSSINRRASLRSSINHILTNETVENDTANFWNVSSRWFADATEQIVGNVSGAAVDDTAFRTSGIEIVSAADFDEDDFDDDDDDGDDYNNNYGGDANDRKLFDDLSSIGDTVTPSDIRTIYSRWHMIKFICKWILLAFLLFSAMLYSTAQSTPHALPMPTWTLLGGRSNRFQPMKEIFIEISGEEVFSDTNSPQYRALVFLAEQDPLKLNPNDPNVSTQIIQRYVLSVLYFATNGPSWKHRVYWLTGQHECGWQYVICSDVQEENNNATDAGKNKRQKIGLTGDKFNPENMDDDFSDFADSDLGLGKGRIITGLKLFDNGLAGNSLPLELVELKYLHILDLGSNDLVGTIETYFSRFTHLRELYLNRNEFHGRLDANMTKGLTKLKVLSLGRNFLTGMVDDQFFQDLTSLENLSLEYNQLSGVIPTVLGNMKALQQIRLGGNALQGKIPLSLESNLPNLQRLWLQDNKLTGTIPSSIFCDASSTLVDLRLQNNSFVGNIPNVDCTMDKLELLSMGSNELEGSIPNDFGDHFPSLKELHLYDNQLTSTIPSSIFKPVNLTAVLLGMNKLTGTLSSSMIQEASNLVYLYLNANDLGGTLDDLAQTGGLLSLKKLRLEYNSFSGTIPKLDTSFPSLELFYAYNNSLLTSGLDNLSNNVALKKIKLSNCSLAGEIPTTFGSLTGLEVLHLNGNHLTGTVPSELQKLTLLEELRLDANDLSGAVPYEICSLRESKLSTFISDCGGEWSGVACSCCTECL
jgi:Leucine-rich repeat (LRR) protein